MYKQGTEKSTWMDYYECMMVDSLAGQLVQYEADMRQALVTIICGDKPLH